MFPRREPLPSDDKRNPARHTHAQRSLFQLQLVYDVAPAGIRSRELQHALMLHMALYGAGERNVVIVHRDLNIGTAQDRIAAHQVVNGIVYSAVGSGLVLRGSRLRDRMWLGAVMR